MLILLGVSFALLVGGLMVRPHAEKSTRGPLWKARDAFPVEREYRMYVTGTLAIVVGALILGVVIMVKALG